MHLRLCTLLCSGLALLLFLAGCSQPLVPTTALPSPSSNSSQVTHAPLPQQISTPVAPSPMPLASAPALPTASAQPSATAGAPAPTATLVTATSATPQADQPGAAPARWVFQAGRTPCSNLLAIGKSLYGQCGITDWFGGNRNDPNVPTYLHVLDRTTGHERWRYKAVNWFTVAADTVFVPCRQYSAVCALDVQTGQERWYQSVKYPIQAMAAVADGVAYISGGEMEGTSDPHLYAVDVRTGRMRWSFANGDGVLSGGNIFAIAFSGDLVYTTSRDGVLRALDRANGREHWQFATDRNSPSAAADGMVYTIDANSELAALDGATGQLRWHLQLPERSHYDGQLLIEVANGNIYVWQHDGAVWAIDRQTRQVVWQDSLSNNALPQRDIQLVVMDGVAYQGTDQGTIVARGAEAAGPWANPRHLLVGTISNGGNLRSAAHREATNVIGQVCPGDQATVLQQTSNDGQRWYRVRTIASGANCHPERVPTGSAGWVNSTLMRLP